MTIYQLHAINLDYFGVMKPSFRVDEIKCSLVDAFYDTTDVVSVCCIESEDILIFEPRYFKNFGAISDLNLENHRFAMYELFHKLHREFESYEDIIDYLTEQTEQIKIEIETRENEKINFYFNLNSITNE